MLDEVRLRGEAVFRELGWADRGREGGVLEVGCGLRASANGERHRLPTTCSCLLFVGFRLEKLTHGWGDGADAMLESDRSSSKDAAASPNRRWQGGLGQSGAVLQSTPYSPQSPTSPPPVFLCLSTSLGLLRDGVSFY